MRMVTGNLQGMFLFPTFILLQLHFQKKKENKKGLEYFGEVMALCVCLSLHRICESLGLSPFDLSDKEMERIDAVLKNIQDSSTILRSSDDCTSPGHRKISSAIFDMTQYLAQSPPPSPANSEPESPRSSYSSLNELSKFSRQISDPDSSETESDQSDVFTENEVCSFVLIEIKPRIDKG